eukprot:771594_1
MNDLLEKDAILARGYVDIIRYLCPLFLNPYDTTKRGMQSYNVHGSMTQTADASPEPHKTSSNPNRKITTERESSNACINKRKMNKENEAADEVMDIKQQFGMNNVGSE